MKEKSFIVMLLKVAAVLFVSLTTITVFFVGFGIVLAILIGVLTSSADDFEASIPQYKTVYGEAGGSGKLLALRVNGVILGERDDLPNPLDFLESGVSYGYEIKQQLVDAAEDESIKGVILEINSPGGTIFGSHAIADGVAYYKQKTKKPVVAYIGGLGASGGYWVAASTDSIFADYGSTIGSIGVIFGPIKYYDSVTSEDNGAFIGGVVTQNGIDTTYFTAGRSKDVGNPYRRLTPEEIATLQRSVNSEYEQFVSFISARRKIQLETLRDQIGAMVYENESAESLDLIDDTKNKEDSYRELARRAGLEDDFEVIGIRREPAFAQLLLESIAGKQNTQVSSCPTHLSSMILAYHGDLAALCQ